MKKLMRNFILIALLFGILSGCGPKAEIVVEAEESKIIMDTDRGLITFLALIKNTGTVPSNTMFAEFEINHQELIEEIGESTIPFTEDDHTPTSFTIDGNSGFFIGESFALESKIPFEELVDAVDIVLFDEQENDIVRFTFEQVEQE